MKQKALMSAISLKAQSDTIMGIQDFALDAPKTKSIGESLKSMNLE